MTTVVIDASAIAALLFCEPRLSTVEAMIAGRNLVAPRLLRFEIISIALKKRRLQPDAATAIERLLRQLPALAVQEVDTVATDVFEIASATGLSAYDASYLSLARRLKLPLVTLDAALARAAVA